VSKKITKKGKSPLESIEEEAKRQLSDPWISRSTGILVIAVVSLLLMLWIFSTGNPEKPLLERLVVPLIFGATIWIIAIVFYFIHRLITRR
jgi:sterol desaturase/sphingolipid hydroxylase (fatty acid hydroxylase superfamily)